MMEASTSREQPQYVTSSNVVQLGLAGAYTCTEHECSHYDTKVGGKHAYLPGRQLPTNPNINAPVCGTCTQPLSLLIQAYAPLHGVMAAPERCLYVYACTKLGCGKSQESWCAMRCQLPVAKQSKAEAADTAASEAQVALATAQLGVQAVGSGFDGDNNAFGDFGFDDFGLDSNATTSPAFNFSDLNKALDVAAQGQKQPKQSPKPAAKQSEAAAAATQPSCQLECSGGTLPEFYILAAEEPEGKQAGLRQQEVEHIQQLLRSYQQEEAQQDGKEVLSAAVPSRSDDADDSGEDGSSAAGGQEPSWAPEEYEEDEARGVDAYYLKYNERLIREPQQCVRYSWNGPLLWPRKQLPDPGTCPHCGAARVPELQVMAPIISLMMEAAEVQDAAAPDGACSSSSSAVPHGAAVANRDALTGAANWEMCTVAVFTCSQSCCPATASADTPCCLQEYTVLVNESECHVPIGL